MRAIHSVLSSVFSLQPFNASITPAHQEVATKNVAKLKTNSKRKEKRQPATVQATIATTTKSSTIFICVLSASVCERVCGVNE